MKSGFEKGRPLPAWYLAEPDVPPVGNEYLHWFWELWSERHQGFGVGPIPLSKIREHGEFLGLDRDNLEVFSVVIRTLDSAYLQWTRNEQEKKNSSGKRSSPEPSGAGVDGGASSGGGSIGKSGKWGR